MKMKVLGHHYFSQKRRETSLIKLKGKMAPTIAPKINPTLRKGVGSTTGARDGNNDKDVAMDLVRATAPGDDRFIGGLAPAGWNFSTSTTAPRKVTKLCIGAGPDRTGAIARAGLPKRVHLVRDKDNEDLNDATAVRMARLRTMVGATDRGPATVTDGAAPAGEYRSASGGLVAAKQCQYKKEAVSAHGASGAAVARTQYRSASVGVATEKTSQGKTG
jgi:hypothetical protein